MLNRKIFNLLLFGFILVQTVYPVGANAAPTANAGPDQSVLDEDDSGFAEVTLDASGSFDATGIIQTYRWFERNQLISTGVSPTRVFTAGTHTVTLQVTNDMDETSEDEVIIKVIDVFLGLDIAEVPDYNGNNTSEVAVLKIFQSSDLNNERILVQYNDSQTGQKFNEFKYLNPEFAAKELVVLPGIAPNGGPGVGVWANRRSDGLTIIQVKNPLGGVFIGNVFPLSRLWTVLQIAPVPNASASGGYGLAVLGTRNSDGLGIVQVRDPLDNSVIRNVFPLGLGWTPISLAIVPDIGAGVAGIAVLSVRDSDGLPIVQIRSMATGALVRNVFPLRSTFTPVEMIAVRDANDDGVWDIATRMIRISDGLEIVQVRDSIGGTFIRNLYPPQPPTWQTRENSMITIDNNSLSGLGVLTTNGPTILQNIVVVDGSVEQNTSVAAPAAITAFGDMNGNGVSELAVLVQSTNNFRIHVWDLGIGTLIQDIFIGDPL